MSDQNRNSKTPVSIFWFRRDLRLHDIHGLSKALLSGQSVVPLFIFDHNILNELPRNDARVSFIYECLENLKAQLSKMGSDLVIKQGDPLSVWQSVIEEFNVKNVFYNQDFEPYGIGRDKKVNSLLEAKGINVQEYLDHVVMGMEENTKTDGTPYTVFTPFKRKFLANLNLHHIEEHFNSDNWHKFSYTMPSLQEIGFEKSSIKVAEYQEHNINKYSETRDFPALEGTTRFGPHLRFGTVSVRQLFRENLETNSGFINELIWREFFIQILYHFPQVVHESFKAKYDRIEWRNDEADFEKWCTGKTGYPLVDAGMRELNEKGYMHNRVRMVVASFLCKHLLIHWRWGEAYFAQKLLDFDLAANNGNWQWAAGTGCDAAPYFRIFNPSSQHQKFDKESRYVKQWVPELETGKYVEPMVDHKFARERALRVYKAGLSAD